MNIDESNPLIPKVKATGQVAPLYPPIHPPVASVPVYAPLVSMNRRRCLSTCFERGTYTKNAYYNQVIHNPYSDFCATHPWKDKYGRLQFQDNCLFNTQNPGSYANPFIAECKQLLNVYYDIHNMDQAKEWFKFSNSAPQTKIRVMNCANYLWKDDGGFVEDTENYFTNKFDNEWANDIADSLKNMVSIKKGKLYKYNPSMKQATVSQIKDVITEEFFTTGNMRKLMVKFSKNTNVPLSQIKYNPKQFYEYVQKYLLSKFS